MERIVLLRVTRPLLPQEETVLLNLVDEDRGARLRRISEPETRQLSLLANSLVRRLVCEQWGLSAQVVRMEAAAGGKPVLQGYPTRHFNVSHTPGGILCALSDRPVGVDMEHVRTISDRVAARWFTPEEQVWAGRDMARRLILWTRKEAAAKWSGAGLAGGVRTINTCTAPWQSKLISFVDKPFVLSVCEQNIQPFCLERVDMPFVLDWAAAPTGGPPQNHI